MFWCAVVKTFSISHNSFSSEQISDRGSYRKTVDWLRAHNQPIRFNDLEFWPAKMFQKKMNHDMSNWIETSKKSRKKTSSKPFFHLNTKSVDCVRTIVDVVWPCSCVEPQKARKK